MMAMRKQMVVVFGSPKTDGHTRILLDSFLSKFRSNDNWEITEFDTYDIKPHPCTACGVCKQIEACKYKDLDEFDVKLREADIFVIASPVYNYSFPAPLKAMLDRSQRYYEARFSLKKEHPIEKHRDAVLLLTMGSDDSFGVKVARHQLKRTFSVMNTSLRNTVVWKNTDRGEENKESSIFEANKIAREILLK